MSPAGLAANAFVISQRWGTAGSVAGSTGQRNFSKDSSLGLRPLTLQLHCDLRDRVVIVTVVVCSLPGCKFGEIPSRSSHVSHGRICRL